MNFSKTFVAIAGLSLLASCGTGITPASNTSNTTETTSTISVNVADEGTTSNNSQGHSYDSVVSYKTPGGDDSVRFVMNTDENGIITSLVASLDNGSPISGNFIKGFSEAASSQIVGKKIADIADISAVGGASLTTQAFKDFVSDKQ